MLDKNLLSGVLEEALRKGGEFAEIYVEEKWISSVFCEDDRIEKINSGREKGVGIRILRDGKTAYVYSSDLSEDALYKAARMAAKTVAGSAGVPEYPISLQLSKSYSGFICPKIPQSIAFDRKIEHILLANRAVRDLGKEIKQVTVSAGDIHKKIQIANSNGELAEEERFRVRLLINAVAAQGPIIQTGYESAGGTCGWEMLEEISFQDMAVKAGNLAIKMLSAKAAPVGKMPVVMSSDAGGTMIHEACGHGLEADLLQKGLSVYQGKQGEQVAAKCVTVIDDATLGGKYGSFYCDDEGTPAQRTILIQDGILKNFMYDRLTAAREGKASTGNGRRESYQHKPLPRMSNTFIAPGDDNPEDIIKSTSWGLLVKKMGGGQVNTTNGDFVFEVQEGYIIEDGEVKYPVRGATLSGNGPEALKNIDRVGKDLGFAIGVCGKDGQGVPVSDAQPTIRIQGLTVGGSSAENRPGVKKIRRK